MVRELLNRAVEIIQLVWNKITTFASHLWETILDLVKVVWDSYHYLQSSPDVTANELTARLNDAIIRLDLLLRQPWQAATHAADVTVTVIDDRIDTFAKHLGFNSGTEFAKTLRSLQ